MKCEHRVTEHSLPGCVVDRHFACPSFATGNMPVGRTGETPVFQQLQPLDYPTPKVLARHGRHGDQDGQAEQAADIQVQCGRSSEFKVGPR